MNRTYHLIWNTTSQSYQPASELARGNAKGRGRKLALALAIAAATSGALAAPDGGHIVDGDAEIHYGDTTDIHQHSDNVTITWDTFDIDADEIVNFLQPGSDSLALNRVFSADGTQIQGQLNANGRVFIIDANGVLFGETAQVNVGSLVASTLEVSASDDNSFTFSGNGSPAAVTNLGSITASDGGAVALLGGRVSNRGVIQATLGNVALASGNKITLDFAGDGLLNVQVDEAALNALAENHGLIKADGGQVLMTAHASDALLQTVVNNTGVIEARGLAERDGKILLLGGMSEDTGGTVRASGTLDVSSDTGNGGFIETSGSVVKIGADAVIDTSSANGEAGTWLLDPTDLEISYDPEGANDSASHVHTQALQNALEGGNVVLETADAGAQDGDITIVDPIVWASGNRLTLNADNNIIFNDYLHAPNGGLTLNAVGSITTDAEGHINVNTFTLEAGNFRQYAEVLPNFMADDFVINGGTFIRTIDNGTDGPFLLITDVFGLQGLATTPNSAGAVLMNDIDASGTSGWNGGEGFDPIGDSLNPFTGLFSGQGHVISGLTINRPDQSRVGLFGFTDASASINAIGLTQTDITGHFSVGALVGSNAGSISQSYATGAVAGSQYVGGLVGSHLGNISQSYATATVDGDTLVGGLVGAIDSLGSIDSSSITITISQSYATGVVTSVDNTFAGGLLGYNSTSGSVTDSYYDSYSTNPSGPALPGIGTDANAQTVTAVNGNWNNPHDAYNELTYAGLDFTNDWFIAEGSSRPMLRAFLSGDGSISNLYQLQGMAADLDGGYFLTGDIDASATADSVTAGNGGNYSDVWGGRGFAPVGGTGFVPLPVGTLGTDTGDPFTGSLDGQGYVIDGLTINRDQFFVGLFGRIVNASIQDLGLTNVDIEGASYVGSLVGSGFVTDGNISSIERVYAHGQVIGDFDTGGLMGSARAAVSGGQINLSDSVADVNVSSTGSAVGGLAGEFEGNITSSYATGTVEGHNDVGGLVGALYGNITDSYATGAVTGNSDVGGLVGYIYIGLGGVTSSYWDSFTTGQATSAGGTAINGDWNDAGVDAYNQASYSGFDFTNDWFIAEGSSRPMLRAFLSGNGEIHNLYDLQGMAADLGGTYTLMADIDALATANSVTAGNGGNYSDIWGGRGFAPVGTVDIEFTGSLDGNGFVIDGLTINRPDQNLVGLFGRVYFAKLNQVALTQVDIMGNTAVGALVGQHLSSITTNSYSTGLVESNSTGSVGLDLNIVVGGLIGETVLGRIATSYSEASVTSTSGSAGGLVGRNVDGVIANSYATGSVVGGYDAGGLVGANHSAIADVGADEVPWLGISHSYATGDVTGGLATGGLVGFNHRHMAITDSFWNTDVEAVGVGDGDATGATGLTTAEFMDPASFASWGTDINATGAGSAIWRIYESNSAPLLRTFLTDIDVIAYDDYKVYDGNPYDGHHDINGSTGAGVRYGTSYAEFLSVFGEDGTPYASDAVNSSDLTYEGDSQGAVDAGTYTITPGNLWSSQTGFNITLTDGELTIDQMIINLSININDADKVYGESDPGFTWNITSGSMAQGDTARLRLQRQSGEDVGNYIISGTPIGDLASGNYDVTLSNGVFTITPRPITIDITDLDKVYGETDPTLSWTISGGSLAFDDTLTGTLTREAGENVGDYAITGEITGDLASDNYTVTVNDGVLTITPRPLVITAEDLAKIYGEEDPEFVWAQGGTLAEGDTISVAVTREAGEDVGNYTLTPMVSGDVLGENYDLSIINGELVISPAALTVTADDIAAYWHLLPPFTASVDGLANGDTVTDAFGNSLTVTSNMTLPIPGDYTLTPAATLASNNYTVSFVNGTLTLLNSHPRGRYIDALTSTQLPAREALGRQNLANIYEGRELLDGSLEAITLVVLDGGLALDPNTLKRLGIPMPEPVYFLNNRHQLSEADKVRLAEFAEALKAYPDMTLKVDGHTSSTGPAALNERLGQRRAKVVADFLTEQGIDPARISWEGHSFRRPAATNETLEGQALNRRTEVSKDEER